MAQTLEEGQDYYRQRADIDTAKVFIAAGQIQRQKGDQIGIEVCTGKALLDGHLKVKEYRPELLYVVNHENGTIYNDIVKFKKELINEATKQFNAFSKNDTTIMVRGSDGQILKQKGDERFVGQNLAYLYNDYGTKGVL